MPDLVLLLLIWLELLFLWHPLRTLWAHTCISIRHAQNHRCLAPRKITSCPIQSNNYPSMGLSRCTGPLHWPTTLAQPLLFRSDPLFSWGIRYAPSPDNTTRYYSSGLASTLRRRLNSCHTFFFSPPPGPRISEKRTKHTRLAFAN